MFIRIVPARVRVFHGIFTSSRPYKSRLARFAVKVHVLYAGTGIINANMRLEKNQHEHWEGNIAGGDTAL